MMDTHRLRETLIMEAMPYFSDILAWLHANREWLFQGVGLSVSLAVAAATWKAVKILGLIFWRGLARIGVFLRTRSRRRADVDDGREEPSTSGAEASALIAPTQAEIVKYRTGRAQNEGERLVGRIQERYGHAKEAAEREIDGRKYRREGAGRARRKGLFRWSIPSILLWAAVANLVLVALKFFAAD